MGKHVHFWWVRRSYFHSLLTDQLLGPVGMVDYLPGVARMAAALLWVAVTTVPLSGVGRYPWLCAG